MKTVLCYGGGVDSTAILVGWKALGFIPDAIVMADPGSEWPETYRYRDEVLRPWLKANGFPELVVVTRMDEINVKRRETLLDDALRKSLLPSAAYGRHTCSLKWKADPINRWIFRQPWAIAEVEAGRKIRKVLGYDVTEGRRAMPAFSPEREARRAEPWYPLIDWGWTRSRCKREIAAEIGEVPPKSACTFCPYNQDVEWRTLERKYPELYAEALELERRAAPGIRKPDVVGLRRRGKKGQRTLADVPAFVPLEEVSILTSTDEADA